MTKNIKKYIFLSISIALYFTLFSIFGVLAKEGTRYDFDSGEKARVIATYIIVSGLIATISGFLMSQYLLKIRFISNLFKKELDTPQVKKTIQITSLFIAILVILIMIISICVMAWTLSITSVSGVQTTKNNNMIDNGIANLNNLIIIYFIISYIVSYVGTIISTLSIKLFITTKLN
ncbi:hypothetical protein [Mycoplasma sp. 005V]|uniref:hypothetical protein n=1 Tax=unclassified Mycoplasma TaxID=2683645 RepID=UPI003A838121